MYLNCFYLTDNMQAYQQRFLTHAVKRGALKFGQFELKSGRISPYFFNAGSFNSGGDLALLGQCYADAIVASGIEFDVLFGPAYKGIPLAAAVAVALHEQHGRDVPWCFNRKEKKAHGEGGSLVGASLAGKVLVIDDVITAGTAIREAIDIIKTAGGDPVAAVIALDRQERGEGKLSAAQEVTEAYGMQVQSIVTLNSLITYLREQPNYPDALLKAEAYRDQFGAE